MELREKLGRLTETLFINMYGEGSRNNNIISLSDFNPNLKTHKVCLRIAKSVSSLYNYKIKLGCSFFTYIKFLYKEKKLFKNKLYIWDRKNNGRAVHDWLTDISDAYHENILIWEDVWEYLGGDEELD